MTRSSFCYIPRRSRFSVQLFVLTFHFVYVGIFYNDDGRSFTSILLYGQEWSFLLFNLLLFLITDWASGWNSIVAGFVAYLVDIVLVAVRDSLGRKNLADKTMVDERFLI